MCLRGLGPQARPPSEDANPARKNENPARKSKESGGCNLRFIATKRQNKGFSPRGNLFFSARDSGFSVQGLHPCRAVCRPSRGDMAQSTGQAHWACRTLGPWIPGPRPTGYRAHNAQATWGHRSVDPSWPQCQESWVPGASLNRPREQENHTKEFYTKEFVELRASRAIGLKREAL